MSSQLQDALGMFAFLAIELSVLFIGISLLVGVLQRHIPPSKVEALLTSSGKRGYFLAAGLGVWGATEQKVHLSPAPARKPLWRLVSSGVIFRRRLHQLIECSGCCAASS